MGLKKKQTALLKETKDIESLDSCLPFLYLPPGQVHLFPATGSWTQSDRRGHRNTEPALMSLSLPVFPEPPTCTGDAGQSSFHFHTQGPAPHTEDVSELSTPPSTASPVPSSLLSSQLYSGQGYFHHTVTAAASQIR